MLVCYFMDYFSWIIFAGIFFSRVFLKNIFMDYFQWILKNGFLMDFFNGVFLIDYFK